MMLILLVTLIASVGETLHTRVLEVGGATWPDYTTLRLIDKVSAPNCQLVQDLDSAVDAEYDRRQAAAAEDPFADVFGGTISRDAIRKSIESQNQVCEMQTTEYERVIALDNWQVRTYANGEMLLSHLVTTVTRNRRVLLGMMILFCAAAATFRREHIALRTVTTQRDEMIASLTQTAANAALAVSALIYRQQEYTAAANGMEISNLFMHDFFVGGFTVLTLVSIYHLFNQRSFAEKGSWLEALLCTPLYAFMCLIAILNFSSYGFYHGVIVYMNFLLEFAAVFLNVGLYVWVGLMLARTNFPEKVFDLIRVWRLPPKWLGIVVLLLTAPPTAYTGASAVLIVAAGPAIFRELRRAGSPEQLALATTAIAGSMGTMLRPCLLVVIVATVNSTITTDELFTAGAKILLVSISFYALYIFLLGGKDEQKMAPLSEAVPASLKAMVPLLPYIGIFGGVVLFWNIFLGEGLNEFSAPAILPIVMLLVLAYERAILKSDDPDPDQEAGARSKTTSQAILRASNEAAPLIGALLILMALSASTGGIIERSGVLDMFPEGLSSIWITVTLMMITLIIVGMIMDPYGAVLLVSATLAPLAVGNGMDPLHFWVLTMLAFETGYLTPPVALNHLITRQVVGRPKEWESLHGTFWQRNFRFIFPIMVMGSALLFVAYMPLLFPSLLAR